MTVDITQPATPAEFIAAGATPEQAAALATQHNVMSGRFGAEAKAGMSVELRNLPPPPAKLPEYSRTSPTQATAALQAHQDQAFHGELDAAMSAPASAAHYSFPASLEPETPEAIAADMELRTALHAEGLPRHVVETAASALADAASSRPNETEEQAQSRIAATRATLERWYGKEHEANMRLADSVFDALLAKGGAVADFVSNTVPHLDALSIDAIVQFAKHRASRR